jgi:hypothetical protein
MIVFSQGLTQHSRLGNSLVWMARAKSYLDQIGAEAFFPWALENFSGYLDADSYWMKDSEQARSLFSDVFGNELSAASAAKSSAQVERQYGLDNGVEAHAIESLLFTLPNGALYLRGKVDLAESEIAHAIQTHRLALWHEPFQLVYKSYHGPRDVDLSSVRPKQQLFDEQLAHVDSNSGRKVKAGLHIRRGDYKRWQDGAHYHSDARWIKQTEKLVGSGCAVWVFSDDLSTELAAQLQNIGATVSEGPFEVDFVRMMCMDKIYGPPSTFSGMAANLARNVFHRSPSINVIAAEG